MLTTNHQKLVKLHANLFVLFDSIDFISPIFTEWMVLLKRKFKKTIFIFIKSFFIVFIYSQCKRVPSGFCITPPLEDFKVEIEFSYG